MGIFLRRWKQAHWAEAANLVVTDEGAPTNYDCESWMLGFPISVLTIGGTVYLLFTHSLTWQHSWNLLMLPGTVTWFMTYQLGLTWNMKYVTSRKDRIITRILAVCLIWVVSLIETYPAATFWLERNKGFSTVRKDVETKISGQPTNKGELACTLKRKLV